MIGVEEPMVGDVVCVVVGNEKPFIEFKDSNEIQSGYPLYVSKAYRIIVKIGLSGVGT